MCYFQVLIVLETATVIVGLDQDDFSAKLGRVVDNILGAKQFEVIITGRSLLGWPGHFTIWLFAVWQLLGLSLLIRLIFVLLQHGYNNN